MDPGGALERVNRQAVDHFGKTVPLPDRSLREGSTPWSARWLRGVWAPDDRTGASAMEARSAQLLSPK